MVEKLQGRSDGRGKKGDRSKLSFQITAPLQMFAWGKRILSTGLRMQTMLKTQADIHRLLERPFLQNMCLYGKDEEKVVKDFLRLLM